MFIVVFKAGNYICSYLVMACWLNDPPEKELALYLFIFRLFDYFVIHFILANGHNNILYAGKY